MWWKVECLFGNINYDYSLTLIVDRNLHMFYLPVYQQIENECWFCWSKLKIKLYVILWLPRKIVTKNTKKSLIQNLWENIDTWHFNIKHGKYKVIIIFQYTISHNVNFFVQYQKNIIKSISPTHPYNFDCRMTITLRVLSCT